MYKQLSVDLIGSAKNKNIVLNCLDANTGTVLWKKIIIGVIEAEYNYGFSDATSPCPVTDGNYVWAINAGGGMACYTVSGDFVWERTWKPTEGRPFNKQFDSILFGEWILSCEPPIESDTSRNQLWNYLHAFDKKTGERIWVTKQALTHYNAPVLGTTAKGKAAVMIGRGGPHGVPERPVGLSLISLESENAGNAIWNWEPSADNKISGWGALSTQHWDANKVSWFYKEDHLTIDATTGKQIAKHNLKEGKVLRFDEKLHTYTTHSNARLAHAENQRHCNISVGDYLYYMVRHQPFIARHNTITGENVFLEVPREINNDGSYVWHTAQANDGLNSKGQRHCSDGRVRGSGFQKCFLGAPTMLNNNIYFTNAIGMVYVIDTTTENFDETALLAVNDLGNKGETWTVNSMSFSNGKIFHRTLKEIVCIEN